MSDFNITLFEVCELLNRSKKSISRYIRRGLLHPEKVKSQQGTLEYRFSKADIEAFKAQEAINAEEARQDRTDQTEQTGQRGQTRQDTLKRENSLNKDDLDQSRQDKTEQTGHERQDKTGQDSEVITLLKETTGLLRSQLYIKDKQISSLGGKINELIQRDRETNILIGQLQSKVLMLEKPREHINDDAEQTGQTGQDRPDQTGQDKPLKEKGSKTKKPALTGFWERVFKRDKLS